MSDPHHHNPDSVELPTPTAWPIITAFGMTLMMAGLVTNFFISAIGVVIALFGAIGWFSDVFPHPKHEPVSVVPEDQRPKPIHSAGRVVKMLHVGNVPHRAHIPTEIHPYRVGVLGGIVGGIVMAIMAVGFSLFTTGQPWYTINLMAAVGVPELAEMPLEALKSFNAAGLIVGTIAHISISISVGLLYAVLVPMFPRKLEWLFGGIVTPAIWTGIIWATIRMISPQLAAGIDWPWFVLCQAAFGFACGYVVFKSGKVETMQSWSLAAKLGVESQHRDEEHKS